MEEKLNKKGQKDLATVKYAAISAVVAAVFAGVAYYFVLPSFNPRFPEVYIFVAITLLVFCVVFLILNALRYSKKDSYAVAKKTESVINRAFLIVSIGLALFLILASIVSSPVFNAKKYSNMMSVEDGDFTTDIQEVAYNKIPMLDSDSAQQIGSRKLGELSDLVSQYELMDTNNQINYNGRPVRLIGLEYADIFRWFNNHNKGIPGYVVVDMVTQQADIVRVDGGIRYSTAEHFGNNLMRHVQFAFPTLKFGTPVFEVDDEGTPYWICPILKNTIGLFGGTDVDGAVMVNAITGDYSKYSLEEVPSWVDRLYPASMLIEQYDYYGSYNGGFWNSIFGQVGVTKTTEGYNYVVLNDDVYVYTGVTSVTSDESNIGFLLVNQRTKETKFYNVSGATENSAMSSAQSQVQQMDYVATFPLLLNVADQPTYFMSLKGYDGLVKMYAMVNVESYQIVETGKTLVECEENYRKALVNNGVIAESNPNEIVEQVEYSDIIGIVEDIRDIVMSGDSYYAVKLQGNDKYYLVKVVDNLDVIDVNVGDNVVVTYEKNLESNDVIEANSLEYIEQ